MRIVLATGNPDKARELGSLLGDVDVATASEGFSPEETGTTLFQNAYIKASALRPHVASQDLVLADDSGLGVRALGGRPGVFSSRYAGPDATYEDNNRRLLGELEGAADRSAAFCCVLVALAGDETMLVAAGTLPGAIPTAMRGTGGFGYDPVFVPLGETRSLAELSAAEKDAISHRGRAARRMAGLLRELAA